MVLIRDRVRELRRVKASELAPNPANWRTHPTAQRDALKGILAEVGYAGALLARELPDGALMLIDGHLRAEATPDSLVPVLVLDVTEAEAAKLLVTLDPLAAMAEADTAKLDALLHEVQTGSEALGQMLTDLAETSGIVPEEQEEPQFPALSPTLLRVITLRYEDVDEPALKRFVKQIEPGPLDPVHTGRRILERIKASAAIEAAAE